MKEFEYVELMQMDHKELAKRYLNMQSAAYLFRKEADRLQADREMLLQQIERTVNEREQVVLPLEVAEALNKAMTKYADELDYLAWHIARDHAPFDDEYMEILRDRASGNSFFELIDAIRYGYTVATSPKSTLEDDIYRMIKQWQDDFDEDVTVEQDEMNIARRITEHVRKVFDDRQSG